MAQLLIRAAMNDHLVVGELLAPVDASPLGDARLPIDQLVADAHVAEARPVLAEIAERAGIPYLVDPDTPFLQTGVAEEDRWGQLPFAQSDSLDPDRLDTASLAAAVVEFQLAKGATVIIPPYFYVASLADPWFVHALRLIDDTAEYLRRNGVERPLLPVICGQLQELSFHRRWPAGLDRFIERVQGVGGSGVALYLSPAGDGKDAYAKVRPLFDAARHVKAGGCQVVAWRQGIYGPGLVAAGIDGYECGIGAGERTNVVRQQASRRPRYGGGGGGGGGSGIYIEALGQSVPRRAGQILFGNTALRPKVLCDDPGCCPSVAATLDHAREHAVHSRARQLAELDSQPATWRLHVIERQATGAVALAEQANQVLEAEGAKERIYARNMEALAQVMGELAAEEAADRSA